MNEDDVAVFWYPPDRVGPFIVPVGSVEEGARLMRILLNYDKFQHDLSHGGYIAIFNDGVWVELRGTKVEEAD